MTDKKRSEEEQRRRFGWSDDDVLHLEINGKKIKSADKDEMPTADVDSK